MESKSIIVVVVAAIVVVGIVAYFISQRKRGRGFPFSLSFKELEIAVTTVEGECHMADVAAWFKGFKLDKKKDIPFIMKGEKLREMIGEKDCTFTPPVTKPCSIFLGVYDEAADEMAHWTMIQCDAFDAELAQTLSQAEDGVLVLS